MWKWLKYKKETKLTQIVSEKTIREALADKNLKDSRKKKVIKVQISQERGSSFPPFLEKL
jgi:hypothetical protein